jgi:hypothetical protein
VEEKLLAEKKKQEKSELEDLVGGFFGFNKKETKKDDKNPTKSSSEESSAKEQQEEAAEVVPPVIPSAKKKEDLKKQMWGMGQLKGTFTEAGVELENKLKDIAASATATSLKSCKDEKFWCNMKAKEEAEKRYGAMDDISFKAIKDKAAEIEVENAIKDKVQQTLDALMPEPSSASASGSDDSTSSMKSNVPDQKTQKSLFDKIRNSVKSSLASLEAAAEVSERKVNKYLERVKESAVLTGAALAPEEASIETKREYIATQLKRVGTYVEQTVSGALTKAGQAQVASLQRRGAERDVQNVFTSEECATGKSACLEAAKNSAAKTLGRTPSNVEIHRMRRRAAVELASNVQSSCADMETPASECAAQALSKMKQITGDTTITPSKVQRYIQSGAQHSAASDMQVCVKRLEGRGTHQEIYRNCSLENRKAIAATFGRDPSKVTHQEAFSLRMRGGYMHVRRMIESCIEVATTPTEKIACRSRDAMRGHRRAFDEMTGLGLSAKDKSEEAGTEEEAEDATTEVETLREADATAFEEAAAAAEVEAFASLNEDPTEDELGAAEKFREASLFAEMEKSSGLKLNDDESDTAEFLYRELEQSSVATQLQDMAKACSDTNEDECDLEGEVFSMIFSGSEGRGGGRRRFRRMRRLASKGRKDRKARRDAMLKLLKSRMKACSESVTGEVKSSSKCTRDAEDVGKIHSVLTNPSPLTRESARKQQLANDVEVAAGDMAAQKQIDCMKGCSDSKVKCDAKTCESASMNLHKDLIEDASTASSSDAAAKAKAAFHAAKMRRFWKSQRSARRCTAGNRRKKCQRVTQAEGEKLGFKMHRLGAMAISNAKSAAAEAWSNALKDGVPETDAEEEAKKEFKRHASEALFAATKDAVKKLADAMKEVGKKTKIEQSKTEVISVVTFTNKECEENVLSRVVATITKAASDGETKIMAQGLKETSPGVSSCEVIFSTKVEEASDSEQISKDISTKVDRDLRRRRRLGDSEPDEVSSSPREEEIPYGEEMERTKFDSDAPSSSPNSGSSKDSNEDDDESMLFSLQSTAGEKIYVAQMIVMLSVIVVSALALLL